MNTSLDLDLTLVSVREAARELRVTPAAVRRLIREQRLPAVWLGRKSTRIPLAALRQWVHGGGQRP